MRTVTRALWTMASYDDGLPAALCGVLLYAAHMRACCGRWP